MKPGTVFRVTLGLGMIILASVLVSCAHDSGAAKTAPSPKPATIKAHPRAQQDSSVIALPAEPPYNWAGSVTLSPNGRWLAVAVGNYLVLIRDTKTDRWIRTFKGDAYPPVRWHPSKPVFIGAGGTGDKPAFDIAYLSSGKRHQLFRSDPNPFAWTAAGMLVNNGIVIVDASKGEAGRSGNFGYKLPWDVGLKTGIHYMSSGPNDQVATEVQSYDRNKPDQWIETYQKVPGRKQWVRSGKIEPGTKGDYWSVRQPNWLGDGRLVYLRIYTGRTELWVSNANGSGQQKVTTIRDLKPFEEKPSSDWITIDRQGKSIYYLSGSNIRRMHVAVPPKPR